MAQAAQEMLQESGLQELEQRVLGFLCTNSGNLKLLSTLDDAQRLLHQVTPRPLLSNGSGSRMHRSCRSGGVLGMPGALCCSCMSPSVAGAPA